MKQTHIFSIKISLIIYQYRQNSSNLCECTLFHRVRALQSVKQGCSCCVRTQEGDMRCSSTLCANTSRCPSGGWFWEQRPSMGHGCLWCSEVCEALLQGDTWTPVVGFSLWCSGVKAHQQKRDAGTGYGGRHSKASERGQSDDGNRFGAGTTRARTLLHTHTPPFTMSVCPEPLGPEVLLTVRPVPKYMINVWNYMGCHLWKYLNVQMN